MFTLVILNIGPIIISSLLSIVAGLIIGFFIRVITHEKSLRETREMVSKMIEDGQKEAENKRESVLEAKQEIFTLKKSLKTICVSVVKVVSLEEKVDQRERALDRRISNIDRREELLANKEIRIEERSEELEQLNSKVEDVLREQEKKLIEVANLKEEEARDIIFNKVKDDMADEIAQYIHYAEEEAKSQVDAKAKNLLTLAMQKYASQTTTERTVSVITIPNDEMKGRIIGREGRNIRTLEALTGVDLLIDDTPETVVLSGFDPIRREVAKEL